MIKYIIDSLSTCRKISDVASIYSTLTNYEKTPKNLAILYYVNSWIDHFSMEHPFILDRFISNDLSAVLYKTIPVILFGSNDWAEKRYLPKNRLNLNQIKWQEHILRALSTTGKRIYLVIVPEKDTIIRGIEGEGGAPKDFCDDIIIQNLSSFGDSSCNLSSFAQIREKSDTSLIDIYRYYDTHLLSKDYVNIYYEAIHKIFGINNLDLNKVVYEEDTLWGDLDSKLKNPDRMHNFKFPLITERSVCQVAGTKTFADPLSTTWQSFVCKDAPIKGRIAIFGDSHSSIYAQKRLTYLFANTCEYCDFYWDPFCLSGDFSKASDADYIIFEISQRFFCS